MASKLKGLTQIKSFLGKLYYARNLNQLVRPLYNKTKQTRERRFNNEDIKLVQKIKNGVWKIKPLELPPPWAYFIIESDGQIGGWGAILKFWPTKKKSY